MKETVKELQSALEKMATEFYEESGAKALNIEIRITPWEKPTKSGWNLPTATTTKRARPRARVTIKTPILCQRQLNFTTPRRSRGNLSTIG